MLSSEQSAIVNKIDGQMLCVACPGSGKTTVIIERLKNMVDHGIPGQNILVITFTKEAALQMQKRFLEKYDDCGAFFGTIHSICYRVIAKAYGYRTTDIIRSSEVWELLTELAREKDVRTDDMETFVKNLMGEISLIPNKGIRLEDYKPEHSQKEFFVYAYNEYQKYKQAHKKIDFDDMLLICYDVFCQYPEELGYWKKQFPYIMIDEYQDTNPLQAAIFFLLAGKNGNICVVGDDDQSVYRFRGADSRVFLQFPKKYPGAERFDLSTNYRSGSEIIKRAGLLIRNNRERFDKCFLCDRKDAGNVEVVECKGEDRDLALLHKIDQSVKQGMSYNDMAVLYRVKEQNSLLIGHLLKYDIPFYCTEPPKDYHDQFIFGDIMAYYRLSRGIWKRGDLQRVLNRPNRYLKAKPFRECEFNKSELLDVCDSMGDAKGRYMSKIFELLDDVNDLSKIDNPSMFIKHMCNIMDYNRFIIDHAAYCHKDREKCKELLATLMREASEFDTMEQWLAFAEFYKDSLEKKRKGRDGICLSTLHSAKGLEWKKVFIIDAVEDTYPYYKAESPEDFEEERRLFYVGVTRAKDECCILTVEKDKREKPSRYLYEMGFLGK